jgi:phosphopantothenoylcysteine decarboxylase/phosphopantothenate--cysteine ligase
MKVLVTAGPTCEDLDPVRFLSNRSSGKMGFQIAAAASSRGAEVLLISGPTALDTPIGVKRIDIRSAREMYDAVTSHSDQQDIIIKAAAVADFRPANVSEDKIKKSSGAMKQEAPVIPLERTDDILGHLGSHKKEGQFLCGFSMETQNLIENSRKKLEKKHLDLVAANNVKIAGAGFQGDTNVLTLISRNSETELPLLSKWDAANALLDEILRLRH